MEENHSEGAALRGMPWLASMAKRYGYASSWQAITHTSLPNYLALTGGSTFGVSDNGSPSSHPLTGASVFGAAIARGKTAKTYAEGMSGTCSTSGTARYAVKHNPWPYFQDRTEHAACLRADVPAGTPAAGNLRNDVTAGTLPTVGLVVPDLCDDAHDCPLSTADAWLKGWLDVVMSGPDYTGGRLAIVVTFDEDEGGGPNTVLTVVISPHTSRIASSERFSHYSWTRYAAELSGSPPLRGAADAPTLRGVFHI